jgi:hypothetical protein
LKKYKDHGTIISKKNKDEREIITPWENICQTQS